VQEKKGKHLKTMLAVREEADEGHFLLSPPTASRKTAAPSPMVEADAGTLIYLNSYGDTEAPAEALSPDKEVDHMPDGNIVIYRPSKGSKSAESEATQQSKGSKSAATEAPIVDIAHSSSDEVYDSSEKSDLEFSLAAGLEFSDDGDIPDLHIDSDDEMRSSFPKDTRPKTLILGGLQPPDPTGVPEDKYRKLYSAFKKKHKAITDKRCNESAKVAQSAGGLARKFTGYCSEQLRPMQEVDSHPLLAGHTYPGKDILHLCITEEAVYRGIGTRINRSDDTNLTVVGVDFYVRASFTTVSGF
jgi:hypothetical protein